MSIKNYFNWDLSMKKNKQLQYRLTLLYVWAICYVVMLICFCSAINETTTVIRVLELFGSTSAVILPQLTVILAFFYNKSDAQIQDILFATPFARFAYWSSIFFITSYTALVIVGIPFHGLFGWMLPEVSEYVPKIMGNVLFFSTGAVAYLFSDGRDRNVMNKSKKASVKSAAPDAPAALSDDAGQPRGGYREG